MIQRALACLGLAFLLMAHPFVDLLESQAMIRYHSASPLAPLVIALWIDRVVLAVAFLLVTVLLEKAGLTRWPRHGFRCYLCGESACCGVIRLRRG
jgi:hypothetical protein